MVMMKKIITFFLVFLTFAMTQVNAQPPQPNGQKIFVNNRLLARVNGKAITTYDLVKKMDLAFYKMYPEYASSSAARFQFYQEGWRYILNDLIDEELILADAAENKVTVSSGDVRQEIENEFGPNVIENLANAGMSLEDASKVMQSDLIMQRMLGMKVNSKALRKVTPSVVRKAYEEFIQNPKNKNLSTWTYRSITIKDRTPERTEALAQHSYKLLQEGITMNELSKTLSEKKLLGRRGKVTVSGEVKSNEKELSTDYKKVISQLSVGQYSPPFSYKSRTEKGVVYRILFLSQSDLGGYPPFKEVEAKLKNQLLNEAADAETKQYLSKLRQHYHLRESDLNSLIPDQYQPFELRSF